MWSIAVFVTILALGGNCDHFSELQALYQNPFGAWSWHQPSPYFPGIGRSDDDLSAEASSAAVNSPELVSDYQPPRQTGGYKPPHTKPSDSPSYNADLLPGGVLDVDASSGGAVLPQIPGLDSTSFGFGFSNRGPLSPAGGIGGLFGLGGLFGGQSGESGEAGFGGLFGPEYRPWWRGENVCIDREHSTDDEDKLKDKKDDTADDEKNATKSETPNLFATSISLSNCHQSPNKYECITKINNHGSLQTFTVRYKCCYGYQRSEDGAPGCTKKIDLKPLMETLTDLQASEFKSLLVESGLESRIAEANFTVFAPTDMALQDFSDTMNDMNRVEPMRRRRDAVSSQELALNHVVAGFIDTVDLKNEQLLSSENNNKSIRINIYPTHNQNMLITANCAPIKKSNNLANNGIIHLVDRVIAPASQSIEQIIAESSKLTSLRRVLENADVKDLFTEDGHFTIFAPTDEAFDKLDQNTRKKLLEGNSCAGSVIKHHVVSHTVCASAIVGNATTHNIEGQILRMQRTGDDELRFEKATITKPDIIATNGVVHLIDTVIIPDSALYAGEALKSHNLTEFYKIVEEAELLDEIDGLNNATLFAPTNTALTQEESKTILKEIREDENSKDKLKDFIRYHIVPKQVESCEMENNEMLDTAAEGSKIRVNLYSTLPVFANVLNRATANCARVMNFDEKACGSVLHEISRVLVPPSKNLWEQIKDDERYSTLVELMQGTDLEQVLSDPKQSITFAAPDNDAFKSVSEVDLKTLREDKEKTAAVLKNHVLTEILCCSGVGSQPFGFTNVVSSLSGQQQIINRNNQQSIRIGRGVVTQCDRMATNGVLHTINRLLFPQRQHNNHFGGFFLFDL